MGMFLRNANRPSLVGPSSKRLVAAILLFALHLIAIGLNARQGALPASRSQPSLPLGMVSVINAPQLNTAALLAEDAREPPDEPLRFAQPVALDVTPQTHGTWEQLPAGGRLWRLRFHAAGATNLNFGFSRFRLPAGATLHVSSEDRDYYEGPYDYRDMKRHGELWLPVVPGDHAVIEMYVPAVVKYEPELHLTYAGKGYRDLFGLKGRPNLAKQQGCNIDVVCPEGDAWRDQIRSVATYTRNGQRVCTGQLVADVPGSLRNFFLTANHCRITEDNADTVVVYWNYQSQSCGDLGGGSLSQNQVGSTFLAASRPEDFTLLELDTPPDAPFNVFYSGWDRSEEPAQVSVAIHHPGTDEKAISFNDDPLTTMDSCINSGGVDSHWRVDNWELGTTEPGSSGSGLWDAESKKLIGVLSGGQAACGNQDFDCFGKFSAAWDGDDAASRLRDWLDPDETDAMMIEGIEGLPFVNLISRDTDDHCSLDPLNENGVWEPGEIITVPLTIGGPDSLSNLSGKLTISTPGVTVLNSTGSWPNLAAGSTVTTAAPHFSIRLDSSVACFSVVEYSVEVTAAEGGPFLLTGSAMIGSRPAPMVPVSVPDFDISGGQPSRTESPIVVTDNVTIQDLKVFVNLSHESIGDVSLRLEGPDGASIRLLDRPGFPNQPFGCTDRNMEVLFSDDADVDPQDHCAGQTPWFAGEAKPIDPLAAFNGKSSAGTWILIVEDNAAGDSGTIHDWELRFDPAVSSVCRACEAAPPRADLILTKQLGEVVQSGVRRYMLTVKNAGPDAAAGVVVEERIAGASHIIPPQNCTLQADMLICNVGILPVGAEISYPIDASRAGRGRSRSSGAVVTTGRVSGNEEDPAPGNNLSLLTIGAP
ncbi:MAG: proprotein convertase P-domain-containing protein [Acidobacteria bacterium]|nr:proprotein convertase P-domain-containing protein [Acidobacteriota bacterium]